MDIMTYPNSGRLLVLVAVVVHFGLFFFFMGGGGEMIDVVTLEHGDGGLGRGGGGGRAGLGWDILLLPVDYGALLFLGVWFFLPWLFCVIIPIPGGRMDGRKWWWVVPGWWLGAVFRRHWVAVRPGKA